MKNVSWRKSFVALAVLLAACNPEDVATGPAPFPSPYPFTSNAVPAGVVRVHQFYLKATDTSTCAAGNFCIDDFVYPCGAVKDFPESETSTIKSAYSACVLEKEVNAADHTELFYNCQNNCTFVNVACTCVPPGGTKRQYTCLNPLTGGALGPGCVMLYP